jgi:hypothetical protein
MKTPVALILFNRPVLTKIVFERIAESKPSKILLIADGPRRGNKEDVRKCAEARRVVENITWECEVYKCYSEINLGCKERVSSGIDWVFENVDSAIILEDDCVPHLDFFIFCDELLHKYKNDTRIMQINGNNFQFGKIRSEFSYYFSRHPINWGWATWRRAWQHRDNKMQNWPDVKRRKLLVDVLQNEQAMHLFTKMFQKTYDGEIDTWDHQWTYVCWLNNGLCISPNTTLVTNIGFGEDATHTKNPKNAWGYLPLSPLKYPLKHPPYILPDSEADRFMINMIVDKKFKSNGNIIKRFYKRIKKHVKQFGKIFARNFFY